MFYDTVSLKNITCFLREIHDPVLGLSLDTTFRMMGFSGWKIGSLLIFRGIFMEGLSYQSAWASDVPTQFSRGQGFQEALALVILASKVMWKMNFWIIQCFHNHFASVASVWRGRSSTVAIWSQYKKKEERKLSWGGCLFSKLNALSMCPSKKLLHCLIIQSHCSQRPLKSSWSSWKQAME